MTLDACLIQAETELPELERSWRTLTLRQRRQILASMISTWHHKTAWTSAEWREDAEEHLAGKRCGSAILAILGPALLSLIVKCLAKWLWDRYQERHNGDKVAASHELNGWRNEIAELDAKESAA